MKLFGPANATLSTLETEYRQQSDVNISVYIVLKVILTQNHFTFHFTLELWKLIMFCSPNAVNVILIYCKIFCVCVFFWADFSLSGYWGYTVWLFQLPDIDNSPVISHNISTFHSCKWKKDITEKSNLSLRREVWLHHSHVDWLITRLVKSVNIENIITSVWCMDGILSARQAG